MSVKWNGKSVYQLKQKKQRIHNLDAAMGELNRVRSEAVHTFREELGRIIERDPDTLLIGSWGCNDSPAEQCVYDLSTDERDNECLFCHEPAERK